MTRDLRPMTNIPAPIIAPSILSSNFTRLAEECQAVLEAGADWLHVDVMDGHFVPNITIGLPVVEALRGEFPDAVLDVHVMIDDPDFYAAKFVDAGADVLSFHPEASAHTHRVIQQIHDAGGKASLAINPATPLDVLDYVVDDIDMVLIMSVNPGFGGQSFIPSTLPKLRELRQRLAQAGRPDVHVQVDGGVKVDNIADIYRAGANVLVSGSGIFKSDSYEETIAAMRRNLELVGTV
jgi:ribulose-phosphate 3-epimerase